MEQKSLILDSGPVVLKTIDTGNDVVVSGYASTFDIDLVGDKLLPNAFNKHLDTYKKVGRYWLNHSPNTVLGKVEEIYVDSTGLYIEKAVLAPTKLNQEYVIPLLKSGAFAEHSIQFKSMSPVRKDGILLHGEIYIFECSIVSIACNPSAVITGVKSLIPADVYFEDSLQQILRLEQAGVLRYPSDVRKDFFVNGLKGAEDGLVPDFMDVAPTEGDLSYDESTDSSVVPVPPKEHKEYAKFCESVYLAKSATRKSYLFRIGELTENGYRYSWGDTAVSLGALLGAKGPSFMTDSVKLKLFEKIFDAYDKLGKPIPKFNGVDLRMLSEDVLQDLSFKDVEFMDNEKDIISKDVLLKSIKSVQNGIDHYVKTGAVPEDVVTELKSLYSNVQVSFFADSADSMGFITAVLELYRMFEEGVTSYDSNAFDSAVLKKIESFSKFVSGKPEVDDTPVKVENDPEPDTDDGELLNAFVESLSEDLSAEELEAILSLIE